MERRKFVKASLIGASMLPANIVQGKIDDIIENRDLYELRVYRLKPTRFSGPNFDNYIKTALIPALNRYGVKNIGVYSEIGKSEPTKIYLLIPYPSFSHYFQIPSQIKNDNEYKLASSAYHALPLDKMVYSRYDTSIMLAFDGIPRLILPNSNAQIFELRTYQGYSEDAVRRKVLMFNKEELEIFKNTGMNSVFFGDNIAGPNLPCLTYMLAFKSMEERNEAWKTFLADTDWKRISKAPEYANSVSDRIRVFLAPLEYSQI